MPGPFYFAWVDATENTFGPDLVREDEDVFSIEVSQSEGDFAQLKVTIRNPRIGLLAPGRNIWGWLSWDNGSEVIPLFFGRLVAVPDDLNQELLNLMLVARPLDYIERKAALANTMRVLPWWDPVWLVDKVDDPDTVLETRTELWHIDRVTLDVTTSDYLIGEAGIIDIGEVDHLFASVGVTYTQPPLRAVRVNAAGNWTQKGEGDVDITRELVQAFQNNGSSADYPMISSFTAKGLLSSWPKPGASIGGGWTVGVNTSASLASADPDIVLAKMTAAEAALPINVPRVPVQYLLPGNYTRVYGFSAIAEMFSNPGVPPSEQGAYTVTFPLHFIVVSLALHYEASRERSEIVSFVVSADLQSVQTEADEDFILVTTGDVLNGETTVSNIATLAGVVPGVLYGIEGDGLLPGNTFVAPDVGQWSTPGFTLITTGDTRNGSTYVDHIGSISGLVPGQVYAITGASLSTTFIAPSRGGSLTLDTPATVDADGVELTITPIFAGITIELKQAAAADVTGSTLTITLPAANALEEETISLNSSFIDKEVDGDGQIPIGDVGLNSYFKTDRGQLSFEFLVLMARAKLLSRARVVQVKFRALWDVGLALSCRHSVRLTNRYLPGGAVVGKVVSYSLISSPEQGQFCDVTIGCSVGRGGSLSPVDGTPVYVDAGYVEPGYQATDGGMVVLLPGEIQYEPFEQLVIDDDGVDLTNMTPQTILVSGATDIDSSTTTTGQIAIGSTAAHLDNTDGLVHGRTYTIEATGIPSGANFVFFGSPVAMNVPATATNLSVLLTITGQTQVNSSNGISVINGADEQRRAIDRAIDGYDAELVTTTGWNLPALPDPTSALSGKPTHAVVNLVPVTGGPFQTVFEPAVSTLKVPKTIDLEAPSA